MTEEQNIIYVKAMLLAAEIEMQAMIAENQSRIANGDAVAYGEKEFIALIDKHGVHHNGVVSALFEGRS